MQWSPFFLSLLAMAHADMKLNGSATQSSDYKDDNNVTYSAERATDGDKSRCSHTEKETDPWWRIDLGGVYTITYMSVTQRDENEEGMLKDAVIHIGNTTKNGTSNPMCANIAHIKAEETKNITCTGGPIRGRYVTFHQRDFVVLCEVEVYGNQADSPLKLVKENKTWKDALDYCRKQHNDLASIPNKDMQVWADLAAMKADTNLVWLGLRYTYTLDFWFWVSDQCFSFDNWAPGNGSSIEECCMSGAMEKEGSHDWVSQHEANQFNFICE